MINHREANEIYSRYLLTEFITLTSSGAPVCWPVLCEHEAGRVVVSTPYIFPTKANNARHNPKVAAFFSDPQAMIEPGPCPYVLVQGVAEVDDADLQRNTERFVDAMMRFPKTPAMYRLLFKVPFLLRFYVGYTTRIYIEIIPQQVTTWERTAQPPAIWRAVPPKGYMPASGGIRLPEQVHTWLPRYTEPPVLSFVDKQGFPAAIRVQARLGPERIAIEGGVASTAGAPACLTYHRVASDMMSNDSFMIRGHFDGEGHLVPEKVVGWSGSADDRGAGSKKANRMMGEWRKQLVAQLAREGRPLPTVRPSPT